MGRPSAAGLGKLSEILPVTGKGRDFVPLRRLQRDPHACRQARPTTAANRGVYFAGASTTGAAFPADGSGLSSGRP